MLPWLEALSAKAVEVPGVVGTGLFVGMADIVLIGDRTNFKMIEERKRKEVGQIIRSAT
jgi:ribose 5-phosphate isomerase